VYFCLKVFGLTIKIFPGITNWRLTFAKCGLFLSCVLTYKTTLKINSNSLFSSYLNHSAFYVCAPFLRVAFFYKKHHVISVLVFLQFHLSRIHILVDMTGKTKGKCFKSSVILSNPSTSSKSKCDRFILLQGGSVKRCENTNISGLPSIRPSVFEYLEREQNTIIRKQLLLETLKKKRTCYQETI